MHFGLKKNCEKTNVKKKKKETEKPSSPLNQNIW